MNERDNDETLALRNELSDLLQRNADLLGNMLAGEAGLVSRYALIAEVVSMEDVRTLAVFNSDGLSSWDLTGMLTCALKLAT